MGKKLVFVAVVVMTGCAMNVEGDGQALLALPALSGVASGLDVHVLEAEVARWNDEVGATVFWEDARDTNDHVTVVTSVGEPDVYLDETGDEVRCEVMVSSALNVAALHRGLGLCLGIDGDVTEADREMLMDRLAGR